MDLPHPRPIRSSCNVSLWKLPTHWEACHSSNAKRTLAVLALLRNTLGDVRHTLEQAGCDTYTTKKAFEIPSETLTIPVQWPQELDHTLICSKHRAANAQTKDS